ncbi:MAG: hypothetical protein IKN59_04985 [Paludibacteraceae bacterium]|nr:hypothetical protein [Paludibacteraceae bacterium]
MKNNNQIDIFSVESWLNLAATAAELAEFTKRQPLAGEFPEQKLARLEREMPMTKLARLVREMADIKLKQPVREKLPQAGAEIMTA